MIIFYTTSYYVYSYVRKKHIVEQADKYIKTKDFDNMANFHESF